MPQPAQESNSWEADVPKPVWGFDLQEAVTSQPGDLHPDSGMPGAQAAAVLRRISFRKTHPYESPPTEIEGSLLVVGLCLVSAITQEFNKNPIAFLESQKEAL